ncbi:MAG: hypothetical protein GXY32_10550 [Ruminococcaceae bacterium]|nr:hypothetical protein [Oscillospiraceae bacterium]
MKKIVKTIGCIFLGLCLMAAGMPGTAAQQAEGPRALAAAGGAPEQVRVLLPTGMEALEDILARMATAEGMALQIDTAVAGDNYGRYATEAMESDTPPDLLWLADETQARAVTQVGSLYDLLAGRNSPTTMRALAAMVPKGQRLLDESRVLGLPLGVKAEGYLVNLALLANLLDTQNTEVLLADLQVCSWQQWQTLAKTVEDYLTNPQKSVVDVGTHTYTMPRGRPEAAQPLRGIFSVADGNAEAYLGVLMDTTVANAFDGIDQLLETDETQRVAQLQPALAAMLGALDLETSHMTRSTGAVARGERYVLTEKLSRADAQTLFVDGAALFMRGDSQLAARLEQDNPQLAGKLALVPVKMPPVSLYDESDDTANSGLYTGPEEETEAEPEPEETPAEEASIERIIDGNTRLLWQSGGSLCVNGASAGSGAAVKLLLRLFTSDAGRMAIAQELQLQCFSSPVPAGRLQTQLANSTAAGQMLPTAWPVQLGGAERSLDAYIEQSGLMAETTWDKDDETAFVAAGIAAMGVVSYSAQTAEGEAP